MIAAIYARKSTEQKNADEEAKSTALQIENARAFARERGWTIAEEHVYEDDAVSGADTRKLRSRQRLLDVIDAGAPFQVLIMRERSRFSRRDGDEAFGELKRIAKAGVVPWFYKERTAFAFGTFTDNVVGFMQAEAAAEYRRQVAAWTYDAIARRARAGFVTGGVLFGYDNVRVDGHVERRINAAEAAVVLEIFTRSKAGEGLKTIAKALNAAGTVAPRARRDRPGTWSPSSVRSVLYRTTYRGVLTWNRTKKRDRDGQQRQHQRPATDWMTREAEHLRIVPDDLWAAVHARLRDKRTSARVGPPLVSGRGVRQKYLLAGFGRCGWCGGAMQVVSRPSGGRRQYRYACGAYWNRGGSVCSNGMLVDLSTTDQTVRDYLRTEVLRPPVLARALEVFVAALQQDDAVGGHVGRLEQQLAELDRKLANLAETAASGGAVPEVLRLLTEHDQQRRQVAADLACAQRAQGGPVLSPKTIHTRLQECVGDWSAGLSGADTRAARGVLDSVLSDRIRFAPDVAGHRYALTLPIAFDRVLRAVVPEARITSARNDGVPDKTSAKLALREHVVVVAAT